MAADHNIRENVSILLENYPFLKVFSKPADFDSFIETNFAVLKKLRGMLFRINFDETTKKTISVTPYIDEGYRDVAESKTIYYANKTMIEKYIKYQLVNSGILDSLSDIPIIKRVEDDSPEFNSCICVRLNPRKKSNTFVNYHNDGTLFQILQYCRPQESNVLGSELLFYHENDLTVIHRGIVVSTEGTPEFPIATHGNIIHDRYNLAKKIYNKIKSKKPPPLPPQELAPPLTPQEPAPLAHIRFILKNGDTMVFPDTLWKHAVINPNEKKDGNILHIKIANKQREDEDKQVKVCSKRIRTEQTQYDGRRIIGLFCFIYDKYMKPENLLDAETFVLTVGRPIPVPIINLTEDDCERFLTPFSDGTGCITIDGVNIISI